MLINDILYLLPDNWYFLFETFHIPNFLYVTCYLIIIVTCQYAKYDVCDQLLAKKLIPLAPIVRLALVFVHFI